MRVKNNLVQLEQYFSNLKKDELGLVRILDLLKFLGNPDKKLRGIHVAGTNGKGSVCAMCQSILTQAGYKVGLYTSPHLVSYTERFRIGYANIDEEKLIGYLEKIKQTCLRRQAKKIVTWFEALTVAAILYFIDEKVDYVVFEAGMGGRLDATNVLDLGVKVITSISFDHMEDLGNTLEQISFEKGGIIRKNDKVISLPNKVIEKICHDKKAKLKVIKENDDYRQEDANLAIAVVKSLVLVSNEEIRKGRDNFFWPGRMEVLNQSPLVLADAAHNVDGMKALLKNLKSKKPIFVMAFKKDKEYRKIINLVKKRASEIILVNLPYLDKMVSFEEGLELEKALERAFSRNEDVIITGSIYFLGEVFKYYYNLTPGCSGS